MSEEIKSLMKKVGCVHRVLVEANHKTRGELKSIGEKGTLLRRACLDLETCNQLKKESKTFTGK